MFIEMQPLQYRGNDYLAELKKAEAKNLQLYTQNASNLKALKQAQIKLVTTIVGKISHKNRVSYRDFIPLYEVVRESKLLNIQATPWWDSLWKKRNTESMQTALSIIRAAAADVLIDTARRIAFRDGADLISEAMKKKLFSEHRSYWTIMDPRTLRYLNSLRVDLISEDRHSRGIWTPLPPLDQMNGWPHHDIFP